jgi:branched-chain amino acid transport system substrate-binding protein
MEVAVPKVRVRYLLPVLVGLAAVAVAAGLASAKPTGASALPSGTYKIGFVESITGRLAFYDPVFAQGMKLAINQINAKGGVGGKLKLQLIEKDGKSDPAQGAVVASDLIGQKVQFGVSPCDADIAIPGATKFQQAKIPVVMACGSGWTFPQIVGDYSFINVYGTAALASAQAEYAIKRGWKRAYNLSSTEYFYGKNIGDIFAARYKQLGGKVAGTGFYKFTDTDFRAIATQVAALKPDVVTSSIVLPGSTTFLKQIRAAGYRGPVVGADSFDSNAMKGAGAALNNTWFTTHACASSPRTASFFAAYKRATGKAPDANFVATGGDLVLQIQAALLKAGSVDPTAVRNAYASLRNVQGVSGLISYAGAPQKGVPKKDVFINKWVNGKRACISHFYPSKVLSLK